MKDGTKAKAQKLVEVLLAGKTGMPDADLCFAVARDFNEDGDYPELERINLTKLGVKTASVVDDHQPGNFEHVPDRLKSASFPMSKLADADALARVLISKSIGAGFGYFYEIHTGLDDQGGYSALDAVNVDLEPGAGRILSVTKLTVDQAIRACAAQLMGESGFGTDLMAFTVPEP